MSEALEIVDKGIETLGAGLPVTRQDLDSLRARISLMKEFVQTQLKQEVDYGIIPGCKAPSLYQPGAQKFARLFGLTVQKECTHREVDRENNYASFTYKATVYHARSGQLLAQCEGSTNSQEKKWATRSVRGGARETTPVTDVLNTLQKMAQKRAFVGAVIEACAASDFFTQDIDSPEDAAALGIRPEPSRAKVTIPTATAARSRDETQPHSEDPGDFVVTFGRNKGKSLNELGEAQVQSFVTWLSNQATPEKPLSEGAVKFMQAAELYLSN